VSFSMRRSTNTAIFKVWAPSSTTGCNKSILSRGTHHCQQLPLRLRSTAARKNATCQGSALYNNASATTSFTEPAINVSGPIHTKNRRLSNVQVATFTHANGVEPASAFMATINWGDGTTSAGTITLSGTTYSVKGTHTYTYLAPLRRIAIRLRTRRHHHPHGPFRLLPVRGIARESVSFRCACRQRKFRRFAVPWAAVSKMGDFACGLRNESLRFPTGFGDIRPDEALDWWPDVSGATQRGGCHCCVDLPGQLPKKNSKKQKSVSGFARIS
jgi:hypothetical protein